MLTEALLSAVAEAVFGYLLQEADLADRVRAVLGVDPERKAFKTALARTYTAFEHQYPALAGDRSLFDETFLKSEAVASLLAQLLTRRGHPDPADLARLWAKQLGYHDPDTAPRLAEMTGAAADFLRWLEGELTKQPALQPLWDSRALERIAENTEAIRAALERLLEQRYTPADIETLRRTVKSPQTVLALGERAVALGGSAQGAVILTGDLRIELNARQRADLERLLAARLHNVPPLPDHYIPREAFLEPLRRALLSDGASALGIVGVKGMGGIGKSVLAAALARDPQVQAAFPDGIVWLSIGREPNLPARQEDLYLILTGERENFKDVEQGRLFLSTALRDKTCLVILDDVWEPRHAEAFPRLSPDSPARYLLTTRIGEVLQRLRAQEFSLDVLEPDQALCLLADWAGQPAESLPPEAHQVAKECGYLPLALAMVGAFVLRNPESWPRALHRLRTADLERLRTLFPGYEHPTLLAALQVSVDALPERARARYLDLAVFPEEAAIPPAILQAFWAPLGLDEDDVADLVDTFVDRSLARRDADGALRLHDLQHDYLRATRGDGMPTLHRRFLLSCAHSLLGERPQDLEGLPWRRLPPATPYLWERLVHHHLAADEWEALYRLLTDFDYLEARCRATSVFDLETDYRLALAQWGGSEEQKRVLAAFEERLRLEEHHIAPYPDYLFPALYNHLTWLDAPDGPLHALCEAAREGRRNWLRHVVDPRLRALLWERNRKGHAGPVNTVAVTSDGKHVISGSADEAIKVWSLADKRLINTLTGHIGPINHVVVSPHEKWIISASADGTVKIWELPSGRLSYTLSSVESHKFAINAVALTPDSRLLLAATANGFINVWNLREEYRLVRTLKVSEQPVNTIVITADGESVVSGSADHKVRVWSLKSGELLKTLSGHTGVIYSLVTLRQRPWIVSCSYDRTIKLWDANSGESVLSLDGFNAPVLAITASFDERFLISGSADGEIRIWDLERGAWLHHILREHKKPVNSVAVTADGQFIVSGSADSTIKVLSLTSGRVLYVLDDSFALQSETGTSRIWRTTTIPQKTAGQYHGQSSQLVLKVEGHIDAVNGVVVTPDGKYALSASADRTIKVWSLDDGALLRDLQGHTEPVNAVAVTPDGELVVSGSADCSVGVWSLKTGHLLRTLKGHSEPVNAVAVTPDGRKLVSGSADHTVKIWDLDEGGLLHTLEDHIGPVNTVAVTPDGRMAISGSADNTVKVWDLENGNLLCTLRGHAGVVTSVAVATTGKWVFSGSYDQTVRVWRIEDGCEEFVLVGYRDAVRTLTTTVDDRYLVVGFEDGGVVVWDLYNKSIFSNFNGHTAAVLGLSGAPNGKYILSSSSDHTVKVWDLQNGQILHTFEHRVYSVNAIAATQNRRYVLAGCADPVVYMWDVDTGYLLRRLKGHRGPVNGVVVTPDGKYALSASADRTIKVWSLDDGALLRDLQGHTEPVNAVAVTPDGELVVSGSADCSVGVWSLKTGHLLRTLKGHSEPVNAVAVTPDGRKLVSGSADHTVKIWDLDEGGLLHTLEDHIGPVNTVAVTPDGRMAISGSADNTVKVWDLENGNLLYTYAEHTRDVTSVTVAPNTSFVISCSADHTIRVMDLKTKQSRLWLWNDVDVKCLALTPETHSLLCGDVDGRVWIFEWVL